MFSIPIQTVTHQFIVHSVYTLLYMYFLQDPIRSFFEFTLSCIAFSIKLLISNKSKFVKKLRITHT